MPAGLSHLALHTYAFFDAAEAFVFLGGYASAAAYCAMTASGRVTQAHGRLFFLKPDGEIHRGFLLTAALMGLCGLAIVVLHIHTPVLTYTHAPLLLVRPIQTLLNIATRRCQPDLAAVLPMCIGFAPCVPLVAPVVRRLPATSLLASLASWLCAPALAHLLPGAAPIHGSFDPFAWQLMFMLGTLCRLHPVSVVFQASRPGLRLTWIALAVALAFAAYKLLIEDQPEPSYLKQNLSSLRVVSFVSVVWLVAQLSRLGWIDRLASALPPVVTVGRQRVTCFVWGTLISIVAHTVLQVAAPAFHTRTQAVAVALLADLLTIAAVLLIAIATAKLKANRPILRRRQHRTVRPATQIEITPPNISSEALMSKLGVADKLHGRRA
ncbi:OpgC domain-containing protein [Caballeronia sp.]|uniref:OpgC domain-containing protein n=1 Tax=Caballeronia sp. TaxID=1931223 RepID=UPI003C356A71